MHLACVHRVARALRRGATFGQAAAAAGCSTWKVWQLAREYDLPRRRRALPPHVHDRIRQRLLDATQSQAAIARDLGVSRSTVCREARKLDPRDSGHRRMRRPRRCPACGRKVYVWPCLTCAAVPF